MLSNPMTIGILYSGLWVLLALPAGVFLILCYQKTRMNGFLWLLVSAVVWPLLAHFLTLAVGIAGPAYMASRALPVSSYMNYMLLLNLAVSMVGGVVLLVSTIVLYRQIVGRLKVAVISQPTI